MNAIMNKIETQGLSIEVYRSKTRDNKLTVDIATHDLEPLDTLHPHEIPDIVIIINEQVITFDSEGGVIVDGKELTA